MRLAANWGRDGEGFAAGWNAVGRTGVEIMGEGTLDRLRSQTVKLWFPCPYNHGGMPVTLMLNGRTMLWSSKKAFYEWAADRHDITLEGDADVFNWVTLKLDTSAPR